MCLIAIIKSIAAQCGSARRRISSGCALLTCAFALFACGADPAAETHDEATPTTPVRLSERLGTASIRSPLTSIPAATRLADLEGIPSRIVFHEDFEAFSPPSDWDISPDAVVQEADAGKAFRLQGRTWSKRRAWCIAADPSTHYVFERTARVSGAMVADFEVVEVPKATTVDDLLAEKGGLGLHARAHWVPDPVADGMWHKGSVSFTTLSSTHAFVIVLWETPRRASQLGDLSDIKPESWFDDVVLSVLEPTREQEIALLKGQDHAPDADATLGISKRGQFPPLRYSGSGILELEGNYSIRNALYAPPPTELAFPLRLGDKPFLQFSYCLSRQTTPNADAQFEVAVRTEVGEDKLWSDTVSAVPKDWRWFDARVDLNPYSNQEVEIILRTAAGRGSAHSMWGNPVVGHASDRPSTIILIAVDTLRADRLSCYGYSKPTSPNLDELARDGVLFENVVSNATWTCPSFASILTGVIPSRHRVWVSGSFWARLPDRFETIAERFRRAGWMTQSIAYKAPLYSSGYDQGFDVSCIVPRELTDAEENIARAMEWLDVSDGLPRFLFLHFNDPHQPFNQPSEYRNVFGPVPEALSMPYYVGATSTSGRVRELAGALYDGEVLYVDDRLGVFLNELRARGLYDSSVIVFVSDHGEALWEHEEFGHSQGQLFDEAIRVPLIVKPARSDATAGRVVEAQVRAFDVMPTLLELAGLPVEGALDAESLVSLLEAGQEVADRDAITETYNGGLSIRTRSWKYISPNWRSYQGRRELLFDLKRDPGEAINVADEHPDVVRALRAKVLESLLLNRPGRYVIGVANGSEFQFVVQGVSEGHAVFGPRAEVTDEGFLRWEGAGADPLAVVSMVELTGEIVVHEPVPGVRPFVRYQEGMLDRAMSLPGLHWFEGPPADGEESEEDQPMDPTQLEALRALGYLGGDEGPK